MITPRYYQNEAVERTFQHLNGTSTHPLIDLPTGTGKALVITMIADRVLKRDPNCRILVLAHVKELVAQNEAEFRGWNPFIQTGIYSAGLNRKEARAPVTFASVQSAAKGVHMLAPIDLIIIDEAHMVPAGDEGQYRSLIAGLQEHSPHLRVVGLTATPYRLSSGRLDEGDTRLFDRVIYRYPMSQAVKDGYLCPLISKRTALQLDVDGVAQRGGEFVEHDLQAAVDQTDVIERAVRETIAWGRDRKSWLVFCTGIDHSEHVAQAFRDHGIEAAAISSRCSADERAELIEQYKAGKLQCLTNPNILTTGFNHRGVDLIALLRPTLSTGLYVQMLGRGTRTLGHDIETSREAGKHDCLVLDFAGNVRRHGPVDAVDPPPRRAGRAGVKADHVATKTCPECSELVHPRTITCDACGYTWPQAEPEAKHAAEADASTAVMSSELEEEWLEVTEVVWQTHRKAGSPDMLRVSYFSGPMRYNHFCMPLHPSFAGAKSTAWLHAMGLSDYCDGSTLPDPDQCALHARRVTHIKVAKRGQYVSPTHWAVRDDSLVIDDRGRTYRATIED